MSSGITGYRAITPYCGPKTNQKGEQGEDCNSSSRVKAITLLGSIAACNEPLRLKALPSEDAESLEGHMRLPICCVSMENKKTIKKIT